MKAIVLLSYVFSVMGFSQVCCAQPQKERYRQVLDSISSVYRNMQECHMHAQSNVYISDKQFASQTYDLYKRKKEMYLKSDGTEILFNGCIVLMVIKAQKQMVVRPVSEKELNVLSKYHPPAIDSMYKSISANNFSETDKSYSYTIYPDKGNVVKSIYMYNKQTLLLEKVECAYADSDGNTNQKSVITYNYSPIPASNNYFNAEKYLIKTKAGYTAAPAYSNYFINVTDPYEK